MSFETRPKGCAVGGPGGRAQARRPLRAWKEPRARLRKISGTPGTVRPAAVAWPPPGPQPAVRVRVGEGGKGDSRIARSRYGREWSRELAARSGKVSGSDSSSSRGSGSNSKLGGRRIGQSTETRAPPQRNGSSRSGENHVTLAVTDRSIAATDRSITATDRSVVRIRHGRIGEALGEARSACIITCETVGGIVSAWTLLSCVHTGKRRRRSAWRIADSVTGRGCTAHPAAFGLIRPTGQPKREVRAPSSLASAALPDRRRRTAFNASHPAIPLDAFIAQHTAPHRPSPEIAG